MNWIAAAVLAFSQQSATEARAFVSQLTDQVDEDALNFLRELYEKSDSNGSDCRCNQKKNPIALATDLPEESSLHGRVKVFMSFSAPTETWLEHSKTLEKLNGVFIIRGLPENSFQVFSQQIMEFRKKDIQAPIQIDPDAFDFYGVSSIPTIVIEDGSNSDKITGNIRLESALRRVFEEGSSRNFAGECLRTLAGQNFSNVGKTPALRKGGADG